MICTCEMCSLLVVAIVGIMLRLNFANDLNGRKRVLSSHDVFMCTFADITNSLFSPCIPYKMECDIRILYFGYFCFHKFKVLKTAATTTIEAITVHTIFTQNLNGSDKESSIGPSIHFLHRSSSIFYS